MQRGSGGKVAPVARAEAKPLDGAGLAEIAKQNGAAALVVFEGTVDLAKMRAEARPGAYPGVVLFTGDMGAAKELLQKKAISAAIVPRTQAPSEGMPPPKTPREWFDNFYEVISAANAGALPSPNP